MELFRIDQKTCNQDGLCAAVCPARIIAFQKGQYPEPVAGARKSCIRCGHCVAICPTGSLDHEAMAAAQCPPVHPEWRLSADQCEHFLRYRRSIRRYRHQPVERELLERLIGMARYAPSGRNCQDARWLVVAEKDTLDDLARLTADWMRWTIENESRLAAVMHLGTTLKAWEQGIDIIFREAPAVIVAHAEKDNPRATSTCTIALTYLELAATSLDMGGCWAGYFMRAAGCYPPLMDALDLPPGHQCFGAMMVGHPKYQYRRLPVRDEPSITWR